MTGLTDERRSTGKTAWAVLWLAVALGCTRLNPAFESGGEAEPSDAEERIEEPPPADAAARPDGSLPVPADAGVDLLATPDARPGPADVGPDLRSDPVPDAAPADTSLVAYWPFDEGAGNSQVADHSGNGNSGGLAGVDPAAVWQPGHAGSALEIPATKGAAVLVSPSPSLDRARQALTISAWVYRLASIRNHNMTVASRQMGATNRELYNLGFQSDVLVIWFYAAEPAAEVNLRASVTAPLNQWIHVAVTWDGKTARLYQDGQPVGSAAYAGPLPATTNPVILGNNANSTGIDQPLGGRLDEVRLYDRALSAAEITALAGR